MLDFNFIFNVLCCIVLAIWIIFAIIAAGMVIVEMYKDKKNEKKEEVEECDS